MNNNSNITIILIGNDGSGKTTLVKELRSRGYNAWERSCDDIDLFPSELVQPKIIDELTLTLPLDVTNSPEFSELITDMFCEGVYWFLVDLDAAMIQDRICDREEPDKIFETSNSLEYFRKRFLQFAYTVGMPIITNDNSVSDSCNQILEFIASPGKYSEIHRFLLHQKTQFDYESLVKYIPPSKDDFLYPILSELFGDMNVSERNSCSDSIWLVKIAEGESKKVYRIYDKWNYFQNKVIIFLKPTIYSHSKQSTAEIEGLEQIRAKATNYFLEIMWRNGLDHSYYCVNSNGIILSEEINDIPSIEVVVKRYCAGTDKHSYYGMTKKPNFCQPNNNANNNSGSDADSKYISGPYVRFDWRNPNHILLYNNIMRNPVESSWYYVYESMVGKERFFKEFLSNQIYCKPFGDKCLPEHLAGREINVEKAKRNALRMFYSISHYFRRMGLEIQDCCFMLDKSGSLFWSEINQDCMRIKALEGTESYDKDIWRTGGSDVKQRILNKWGRFNPLLEDILQKYTFLSEKCYIGYPYYNEIRKELSYSEDKSATKISDLNGIAIGTSFASLNDEYKSLYRSLLPVSSRRVMVTCDIYNGKPALVKSGSVAEYHSNESIERAMDFISIFPDILTVDLNGAMEEGTNNRQIIKQMATKYYTHCGGGIRTLDDAQDILSASARRIVIGTNISAEFIEKIPKDRLIVELSINENDWIMVNGRKEFSGMSLRDTARYLHECKVQAVSITFHKTEGHLSGLNRQHVQRVFEIFNMFGFEKVYIAGGISTVDDLEFIWSLNTNNTLAIPQLGSAIWKGRISIGEIYCAMLSATENSEIPTIIQSVDGKVKGLIYLNRTAIINTCNDLLLWKYSRRYGKVMLKGQSSGNVQVVLKMAVDCDSDALLITVDNRKPFCHTNNTSCFSLQTSIKGNLIDLMGHIEKSSKSPDSYSNIMTKYPGIALMKTMEEFWEVVTSEHLCNNHSNNNNTPNDNSLNNHKLRECCDFIIHFLMYLSSRNMNLEDIFNELNARRWNPKLIQQPPALKSNTYVIGITGDKYSRKSDAFLENALGIRIIRSEGRGMKITYDIVDYKKMISMNIPIDRKLSFIGVRPKDMPSLLATGKINAVVTYNTVMDNYPNVSTLICSCPDYDLRLALIHRKGENIDINCKGKILVAAEHPVHVENYLYNKYKTIGNAILDKFSLDRILGSSETFIVNETSKKYSLCDALVESGTTLEANNLDIWATILDYGQILIGFYTAIHE